MAVPPKSSWPWVKTQLQSVYDQPDATSVHAQFDRVIEALTEKLPPWPSTSPKPAPTPSQCTAFPKEIWRQIWSNNPTNA